MRRGLEQKGWEGIREQRLAAPAPHTPDFRKRPSTSQLRGTETTVAACKAQGAAESQRNSSWALCPPTHNRRISLGMIALDVGPASAYANALAHPAALTGSSAFGLGLLSVVRIVRSGWLTTFKRGPGLFDSFAGFVRSRAEIPGS